MTRSDDASPHQANGSASSTPQDSLQNRDGADVHGDNNQAIGAGGVSVGGSVGGDVITGKKEVTTTNIFQVSTAVVLGAIAMVAIVAITLVALWLRQPLPNGHGTDTPAPTAIPSPLPPTATTSPTSADTPSSIVPAPACYVQKASDEATLRRLIELEGEALARKDLSSIGSIFAPNAFIGDAAYQKIWRTPLTRYQEFFENVQSIEITRTSVLPVPRGLLADAAWFTSGDVTRITSLDGILTEYPNPPGSSHWMFAKNAQGCWQITSLVFNASHIPFPCYCDQPRDEDTLACLIQAESQAVAEENPLLIWAIFAPDATIQDGEVPRSSSPLDFYLAERFSKYDYTEPQHSNITKILIEGNQAIYTSGSQGSATNANGTITPYDNPNPADRWQFQRNAAGCWVIASFAFNQE